jgi:hypothetical protein
MKLYASLLLVILGFSSLCNALSPTGEYQIKVLTQGGPVSLKSTAESVYRSGSADIEVTDTMAEILLQNYTQNDRQYTDALAWTAKALGNTGNARYRDVLTEVLNNSGNKKLNKHVQGSINNLGKDNVEQYKKGMVDLTKNAPQATEAKAVTLEPGQQAITAAVIGMSMEEVYTLCGSPTSTTSHITGKQFRPFNFKGGDDVRTIALYKGQGRIVFSQDSRYNTTWKVLEVIVNPNEGGYP